MVAVEGLRTPFPCSRRVFRAGGRGGGRVNQCRRHAKGESGGNRRWSMWNLARC